MSEKRFVFDNVEVKLTGRKATKQSSASRRTSTTRAVPEVVMVEITPANLEQGSWKKWVKEADLYTIIEGDTDEG